MCSETRLNQIFANQTTDSQQGNRELNFILFEEKPRVLPKPAQLPKTKHQLIERTILRQNMI